jgi:hypothetical protein
MAQFIDLLDAAIFMLPVLLAVGYAVTFVLRTAP